MNKPGALRLCFLALSLMWARQGAAQVTYTHQLTIQPIQVGNGSELANINVYFAEAQKVWDQAGIYLNWLPVNQFINSSYYNIGNPPYLATFDNLTTFPTTTGGTDDPKVVNMWFVKDLRQDGTGANLGGVTFDRFIIIDNEGVAQKRVVPHEIGHALVGDYNHTGAAGTPSNLMNASPTEPSFLSQIGSTHLLLTSSQINTALSSGYLTAIPEPSTYAAIAGSAAVAVAALRRRRR